MLKRLLFCLLMPLTMMAQSRVKYPKSSTQSFGLVVVKPSYTVTKAPLVVFLHGIGGKGEGTSTELDKLMGTEIPIEVLAAVEKYGFIVAAVQSSSAYTLGEAKFARDWALKNLPVDSTRKYLTGLSWGGGGTAYYVMSSASAAKDFDAAAPIAMTIQSPTAQKCKYIVDANLPLWIFHNIDDTNGGTPVSASQAFYDCLASTTITTKPAYTFFKKSGHGGWGEAYSISTIPIPAGSRGLVAPMNNMWEWLLMNSSTKRVSPPTYSEPTTGLTAVISYTLKDGEITLDGKGSANYKSSKWTVTGRPSSVNEYKAFLSGAGWIYATGTLPDTGTYVFRLDTYSGDNYTGTNANTSITVTYKKDTVIVSPPPPPPVTKIIIARVYVNGFEFILYSDGTSESRK